MKFTLTTGNRAAMSPDYGKALNAETLRKATEANGGVIPLRHTRHPNGTHCIDIMARENAAPQATIMKHPDGTVTHLIKGVPAPKSAPVNTGYQELLTSLYEDIEQEILNEIGKDQSKAQDLANYLARQKSIWGPLRSQAMSAAVRMTLHSTLDGKRQSIELEATPKRAAALVKRVVLDPELLEQCRAGRNQSPVSAAKYNAMLTDQEELAKLAQERPNLVKYYLTKCSPKDGDGGQRISAAMMLERTAATIGIEDEHLLVLDEGFMTGLWTNPKPEALANMVIALWIEGAGSVRTPGAKALATLAPESPDMRLALKSHSEIPWHRGDDARKAKAWSSVIRLLIRDAADDDPEGNAAALKTALSHVRRGRHIGEPSPNDTWDKFRERMKKGN